jgi:hypothetical protein
MKKRIPSIISHRVCDKILFNQWCKLPAKFTRPLHCPEDRVIVIDNEFANLKNLVYILPVHYFNEYCYEK